MATKIEIETYLKYAELANAAYAFEIIYEDTDYMGDLTKALEDTRAFSSTQAYQFVYNRNANENGYRYTFIGRNNEQVQTSYEYFHGSPNGFKAALLKLESGPGSGSGSVEYILGHRGQGHRA